MKPVYKTLIILAVATVLFSMPTPKLNAMEPVSVVSMVTPLIKPMIEAMIPYAVRGGVNFFNAFVDVFIDMTHILLLPFGMMESTFGAPFGLFGDGIGNMLKGCLAPLKMGWSMIRVPIRVFTG